MLQPWEQDFVAELPLRALYPLILASNFLDFKALYDVACKAVAGRLVALKSGQQMRDLLGVPADLSQEDEAAATRNNQWIETGRF